MEGLSAADRRLLAGCLVLSAAFLGIGVRYYDEVFPEAAITFSCSRDASEGLARSYLADRGVDLSGFRHASSFGFDERARTYLERSMPAERAGALADGPLALWRWHHRFFRPLSKEEFSVSVTTRGEIAGFAHAIPEDRAGAALPREAARARAEAFLSRAWPQDRPLEFVSHTEAHRPRRLDHTLVWKDPAHSGAALAADPASAGDAQFRIEVAVLGDEVGAYSRELKPPESWTRAYAELRSKNRLAAVASGLGNLLLVAALLFFLVRRLRARDVHWRFAAVLGAAGAALEFLSSLNLYPQALAAYDTTDAWGAFHAWFAARAALSAAGWFLLLTALCAACEPAYRALAGSHLALPSLFSRRSFSTKSFFVQLVVGLTLTFFFFAYENVFYLAARAAGAWSPRDVPYSDLMSSAVPSAFVMTFGFQPAVTEEAIWRLFAVPFLLRATRRPWVAVLVPSLLWGFAHADYPQQPFWIRGIEVTAAGAVASWVFLRFGIVATLVWHYTTDAFYAALLLVRSDDVYHQVSGWAGAGIVLLPLAVAGALALRRGGFRTPRGVTNADVGVREAAAAPAAEPAAAATAPPWPASSRRRLAAAAVLGALGLAIRHVDVPGVALVPARFGDFVSFRISPAEAVDRARSILSGWRVADEEWSEARVAVGTGDVFEGPIRPPEGESGVAYRPPPDVEPHAARYLLLHAGVSRTNVHYREHLRAVTYTVRFFRPREGIEHFVEIEPIRGAFSAYERRVPETAAGEDLSPQKAQARANLGLMAVGQEVFDFELQETRAERRAARTDHRIVYQNRPRRFVSPEDSRFRIGVEVQGAKPGKIERWQHVPESFVRGREERHAADVVRRILSYAVVGLFSVAAAFLLALRIRAGEARFGLAVRAGAAVAAVGLVADLNAYPERLLVYPTSMDPAVFHAMQASGIAATALITFLLSSAAFALVSSLFPAGARALARADRASLLRRSAATGAAGALLAGGGGELAGAVAAFFGSAAPASGVAYPAALCSLAPALSFLGGPLRAAVLAIAMAGVAVHFCARRLPSAAGQVGAVLVAAALQVPLSARGTAEWAAAFCEAATALLSAYAAVRLVLRGDILAYLFAAYFWAAGARAFELLGQPCAAFRGQGIAALCLALAPAALALRPALRRGG